MSPYTSKELTESEKILHGHESGRRIFVAENALNLMKMGQLQHLKRVLFEGLVEVRRITEEKEFQKYFENVELGDFNRLSTPLGYVASKLNKKGAPHTVYYCNEELANEEVAILTSAAAKQMAINLIALGFDMRGILDPDDVKKTKPETEAE